MNKEIVAFIRKLYNTDEFIPLHEPRFRGNEKKYLNECIDSTFVSSVGAFVDKFEEEFARYVGAKYAVSVVNGTAALHTALALYGVGVGDEVVTQPLTFVATANAISYTRADPVFADVDRDTMGLSPYALKKFLEENYQLTGDRCLNRKTGKHLKACIPMHTFGMPCRIDEIAEICRDFNIALIEDAAESLGSYYKGKHTGTFGEIGAFSFNGNKIITSGGGGVLVTDNEELAKRAKHITTTAKVPHKWEYVHDTAAFNYRMPNINAALLLAQLEQVDGFLKSKRELASEYKVFFDTKGVNFLSETEDAKSNFWLNAVIFEDAKQKEDFLEYSNGEKVMTRPVWKLMNKLDMYKDCLHDSLENAEYLEDRVVNIPSSVRV
jgi:aminotransferase in exopolysaccharide biosynthesis